MIALHRVGGVRDNLRWKGGLGCGIIFALFQLKEAGRSKFCFVSGLHPVVGEGAGRPPHVHSCCRSWRPPYRCQFIACQPYLSIHPFSNTHLFIHPPIHIHSTELLGVSLSLCLCCTLARFSNVHCNIRFLYLYICISVFVFVQLYLCICIRQPWPGSLTFTAL